MIGMFGRGLISGYGAMTVNGDVSATGNVSAERFKGGDGSNADPTYGYTAQSGLGQRRSASNVMTWYVGGGATAQVGVGNLTALTGSELAAHDRIELRDEIRTTWRTAITVVAATQIPVAGSFRVRVDPSGGAVTSTAAPLFSGSPADGDEITITNINASNAYTLNHHGNGGVNSGLLIRGGTTVALAAGGGTIHFKYQASNTSWYEIYRSI